MAQAGSNNKKVANRLVAASCAAVLAVYAAGYSRTQSAANQLAAQVAERRAVHGPSHAAPTPEMARLVVPRPPEILPPRPASKSSDPPRGSAKPEPATAVSTPEPSHVVSPEPPAPVVPQVTAPVAAPEPAPVVVAVPKVEIPVPALPPTLPPPPPAPMWKDGTYTGWGYSRHGNIEASVVIERGRIASAVISQCRTRYSCSVIDRLPPQVAQRQAPDVDFVSGATESADAFYGAVFEALSKAK